MAIWKEFKEFAVKGNAVSLAVGIIIGGAFNGIVQSLVNDIVMPPIGYATGGVDFSNLFVALDSVAYESLAAAEAAGASTINYGRFVNALVNFLIVAWILFFVVRGMNRLIERQEQAPPEDKPTPPPPQERLLAEIRDLLKARRSEAG